MNEFKRLETENTRIRDELIKFTTRENQYEFWNLICLLIDNEIELEKYCNE